MLKLDREFVAELEQAHEAVTRAVLSMAQELGRKVVAEGVETETQRSRWLELGCGFGQGYHFGAAMPVDEAERVVRMSVAGRQGTRA